ncbi:MAG: M23 family metallopeptidase [Muribaculaceae bacterium]|nr:M23 family metallopeptidase [Muribaculaceae bacterium]
MNIPKIKIGPTSGHLHKGPVRYRLTFVNENTFNNVWSLKLSRLKVWLLTATVIAGIVCIVTTIMVATPLGSLLPGYMKPQERHEQIIAGLRIDSIATRLEINNAYIANLSAIMNDDIALDTVASFDKTTRPIDTDSLIPASERERNFVKRWEERERYNLSVLTPLAAENMVFHRPVASAVSDTVVDRKLLLNVPRRATVQSLHSGTVIDVSWSTAEKQTLVIQFPNGFTARYSGLDDAFVARGEKVAGGQAIGIAGDGARPVSVELWHEGTGIDPRSLLSF